MEDGAPPGVIPDKTELLPEAPVPAPASSARTPDLAQVAGTCAESGDKSEPITDETDKGVNTGNKSEAITDAKGVPITAVGFSFEKFFKGHGWFKGKVVEIRPGAAGGHDRRCEYEDGDMEDLSLQQLRSLHHLAQKKKNQQGV